MLEGQFHPLARLQFEPPELIYPKRTIDVIRYLGLTSNLQLCLDAGDSVSAPSSPTKWIDRSGNGQDFFLGTTAGADATDPTFNGSVGGLSSGEYWGFDGGDYFVYDTTNEAWMAGMHKDNATWTVAAWVYYPTGAGSTNLFGTNSASTNIGVRVTLSATAQTIIASFTNGSAQQQIGSSPTTFALDTWQFIAVSFNEATGANGATFQCHATQASRTSTLTSPSASDATFTMHIASNGAGGASFASGVRLGQFMAWSSRLTNAQLTALLTATRGRYGT